MGVRGKADAVPTRHQRLDVILRLHGPQEISMTVQHRDRPQAVVGVRIGRALIYFHDWAGAATIARSLQHFSHDGMQLPPATRPTVLPGRPEVVGAAAVLDIHGAMPVVGALRRVTGEEKRLDVSFAGFGMLIFDRGAYASVRSAFRLAEQLCATVMPLPARPSLREVAMDRAAAALTPPPRRTGRRAQSADRLAPRRPQTKGRHLE